MYKWERIPLEGIFNTRDLGGMTTEDGKTISPRRLIRSGELFNLSETDKRLLIGEYSLKKIVDFRTGAERSEKPDPILNNVENVWAPIMSEETMGITHDENSERDVIAELFGYLRQNRISISDYMEQIYITLVSSEQAKEEYGKFFKVLLSNREGSVLWHCSAGKDRVGIGTALLLTALKVPKNVIFKDYMMTNVFTSSEYENTVSLLKEKGADEAVLNGIEAVFRIKETYIETAFKYIEENYHSAENYIEQSLGVDKDQISTLRSMYLES